MRTNHKAAVLARLQRAPATTAQIAEMLGKRSNRGPGMVLNYLRDTGAVIGTTATRENPKGGPRTTTLWRIA